MKHIFDTLKKLLKQRKIRNASLDELDLILSKQTCYILQLSCEKIIKDMITRENEASTGMGKGMALPHVKDSCVEGVVAAVGQSSAGIDFSSLDKQPVYSVILLISPEDNPDRHLQAMEKIFRHLQQDRFRKFLRQSQSAEQIEDLLREVDENPSL